MGMLGFVDFGLSETSGAFLSGVLHLAVPVFPVEHTFCALVCCIPMGAVRRVMDLTSLHDQSESSTESDRHSRSRISLLSGCRPTRGSVQAKVLSFYWLEAISSLIS